MKLPGIYQYRSRFGHFILIPVPENPAEHTTESPTEQVEEEPVDTVMGPPTEREARRLQRAENLDARGGRYWEQQDMDFGSEPGEAEHGVWGCTHNWAVREEPAEDEDEVQCHECWDPITDKAQVRFCTLCGLLTCIKCTEGRN